MDYFFISFLFLTLFIQRNYVSFSMNIHSHYYFECFSHQQTHDEKKYYKVVFIFAVLLCLRLQSEIFFINRYLPVCNSWHNISQSEDKLVCHCCWHIFFGIINSFIVAFGLLSLYHIFVQVIEIDRNFGPFQPNRKGAKINDCWSHTRVESYFIDGFRVSKSICFRSSKLDWSDLELPILEFIREFHVWYLWMLSVNITFNSSLLITTINIISVLL